MRELTVKVLFVCLFFLVCNTTSATSITADQSGNWNASTTWNLDAVPGCFDTIVIPAGITVTVTATVDLTACPDVFILVQGTLFFQSGKKMDLPNGSVVFMAPGGSLQGGGGGGNSNWITIAGTPYWTAGDGNISGPAVLCQACSLPVELVEFEVELVDRAVNIHWATLSELNNDYFLVQRSMDGFNWEVIDTVDGANNSSWHIDYSTEDESPFLGMSYYRLKQVDYDGAFSFSELRVVSNGNFFTSQQLLVLSSQLGGQHNVVIYFAEPVTGPVDLLVVSMAGTIVASETRKLQDEKWVVITIDQALASGIYAVKANRRIEKSFFQ